MLGKLNDACRKMKLDHLLNTTHQNTFKLIKELNVSLQTIKILEENIGSKILDTACNNILSGIFSQVRETKEKNKQMGLHETKRFLHSKGNHQQNKKTTHRMQEHISQ